MTPLTIASVQIDTVRSFIVLVLLGINSARSRAALDDLILVDESGDIVGSWC